MPAPRPTPAPPERRSVLWALIVLVLKALWTAFVIATPVLGAWVASSLAAYSNGPVAVTAGAGLLLFPVLPVLWEAWSTLRRRRRVVTRRRLLTLGDRLVLRTLALNLLFLGALLGMRPVPVFAALSTRGDWMLDGRQGARVDAARRDLFRAADRLEWLYLAVHDDPFARKDPVPPPDPTPAPTPSAAPLPSAAPSTSPTPSPSASPSATPSPVAPAAPEPSTAWPLPAVLHPAVASMPADAERSIETVARYIADRDSTPAGRLKAAHDWVADRIAYDVPALAAKPRPPQDAATVFTRRTAVCAGYAELLAALGKALGLEIVYVHGDARTAGTRETGAGHAWNIAKIGGREYLVDATWDAGSVDGSTFHKGYRTDYYLTPPEIFSIDHFPSEPRWQLRSAPISRGDFFRQPMMTPAFYAERRELVSPTRSQVTVHGPLEIVMRAPPSLFTSATWTRAGAHEQNRCAVARADVTTVTCDLPAAGAYAVQLFGNGEQYGTYHFIGQVEANRED